MSRTQSSRPKMQASHSQLEFGLRYMDDEFEKLLVLAMALRCQVEPVDPNNPSDEDNTTAWLLAQILEDRLTSTGFANSMRAIILGEV